MYISQETPEETADRLTRVIAGAELVLFDEPYSFVETQVNSFPVQWISQALAFVRDDDVWSALVPGAGLQQEKFTIFSFHFPPGLDNSGFVGWLATHLKAVVGTGVMVVCGQNSGRGGIFDYWGAPIAVANQVIAEVNKLRGQTASFPAPAS